MLRSREEARKVFGYHSLEEAEALMKPKAAAGAGEAGEGVEEPTPTRPLKIVVRDVDMADPDTKARLDAYFGAHPDHTLVLDVGHGGSARVNAEDVLTLQSNHIPANLQHLVIQNTGQNATQIGNGFLGRCSGLGDLDLSCLRNVTHIGAHFLDSHFLDCCWGLRSFLLRLQKLEDLCPMFSK